MTVQDRATGWLSPSFHNEFRILLLHACARYSLVCPAYCLMPDHFHLLLLGTARHSDQRLAVRFLRKYLNGVFRENSLQSDAYDHVLEQDERNADAFEDTVIYIRENPVRAGLSTHWNSWPYAGCMIPGYPALSPASETFFDTFWRIHHAVTDSGMQEPPSGEESGS
jgi:putative transposase